MEIAGLIAGLGNPGPQYDLTRHNFGFMVLDALLQGRAGFPVASAPVSSRSNTYRLWKMTPWHGAAPWLLVKPMTYMNLSGEAVGHACRYYKLDPAGVLVVHDELDLPLGRLKIKFGGGAAGHKGIRSITQHLGGPDFTRLRLGIGKPEFGDTASYVLRRFSPEESSLAGEVVEQALRGIETFIRSGLEQAMQEINGFNAGPGESG